MAETTEAQALLDSRRAVYGDRVQNMERTAALWSALLGIKIEDWQVPLMMSAYKMLRTFEKPDYSDNSDDIDGWKVMFVEVMEANHGGIVKARTVEEYQQKLNDKVVQAQLDVTNENIRQRDESEARRQRAADDGVSYEPTRLSDDHK